MEDLKSLTAILLESIDQDIDEWLKRGSRHTVTIKYSESSTLCSFYDFSVVGANCNTVWVVCDGEYFRIKYNTSTKYIITKHGDVFINDTELQSSVVHNDVIRKALEQLSSPDTTDTIFINDIYTALSEWIEQHMSCVNTIQLGPKFIIRKNSEIISTIDISNAINNMTAKIIKINGSILAFWSGNEWISINPLKGNVCVSRLSVHEVECLRDIIVNIKPEEQKPDSLAKSLCRSDKVIPVRFNPMTHNFKSWAFIGFTEAVNLKAMSEDAGLIMQLVKERNIMQIPGIKNVLFNDTKHTTTVLFDDGTITMSKTTDGETYDHEVGFAMCIMKKMYGNRTRFQKEIKKWTSICENANKKIADKAAKKQDKDKEVES